jgi:hypothetical protein
MGVWLNYYAARMRLARELGAMKLDEDGRWIDHPVTNTSLAYASDSDVSNMPPALPNDWIELADRLPEQSGAPAPVEVDTRHKEIVEETDHVD